LRVIHFATSRSGQTSGATRCRPRCNRPPPRGEVGLIFGNVGLGLRVGGEPILSSAAYSAIVVVVIVTTLVTPPALRWSIERHDRKRGSEAPSVPPGA